MKETESATDLILQIEDIKEGVAPSLDRDLNVLVNILREMLTPMERVHIARNPKRPHIELIQKTLFTRFVELHGDRQFADDQAIFAGIGEFNGRSCMLIGHHKGVDPTDRVRRNFGMAKPEGYRKALRLAKLAERFQIPILFVIDTPGAHSDLESEKRGQGMAIAQNIYEFSGLKTPMVALITGEGSSGGALAIGVADRILMLENSVYSVISPESCAAILWRCSSKKELAADNLHLDAGFLLKNGIIHEVIEEPYGCAHLDPMGTIVALQEVLTRHFHELDQLSLEQLMEQRYTLFRKMGEVTDCSI
ncbi:MAG: acetyl-CoA carboxylase carboxyltransferase subunit alpha [Chlamydiia bacterium]